MPCYFFMMSIELIILCQVVWQLDDLVILFLQPFRPNLIAQTLLGDEISIYLFARYLYLRSPLAFSPTLY